MIIIKMIEMGNKIMRMDKAKNLLLLLKMLQTSSVGVTLNDITEKFDVSYRTARRMMATLRDSYQDFGIEEVDSWDREKHWRIPRSVVKKQNTTDFTAEDLATLNQVSKKIKTVNSSGLTKKLQELDIKIKSCIDQSKLKVIENDVSDMAEVEVPLFYPYRKTNVNEDVLKIIKNAVSSFHKVKFFYKGKWVTAEPYGILSGQKSYLVAKINPKFNLMTYLISEIETIDQCNETFIRDENFSLEDFAHQSIGIYHGKNYDIELRFEPSVFKEVYQYQFSPDQKFSFDDNWSATIKFQTSSLVELCHHLFTWEDKVKIIAPKELKETMKDMLNRANKQIK